MFDNIGRVAEQVATSVSRRRFLGSLGRWAGATALGVAGVLTTTGSARAGSNKVVCCVYGFTGPCRFGACFKCFDSKSFTGCGTGGSFSFADSCSHCAELGGGCDIPPCSF